MDERARESQILSQEYQPSNDSVVSYSQLERQGLWVERGGAYKEQRAGMLGRYRFGDIPRLLYDRASHDDMTSWKEATASGTSRAPSKKNVLFLKWLFEENFQSLVSYMNI